MGHPPFAAGTGSGCQRCRPRISFAAGTGSGCQSCRVVTTSNLEWVSELPCRHYFEFLLLLVQGVGVKAAVSSPPRISFDAGAGSGCQSCRVVTTLNFLCCG